MARLQRLHLLLLALAACRTSAPADEQAPPATANVAQAGVRPNPPEIRPLATGETGVVVRCGKLLTLDGEDRVFAPGVIVIRNGKIEAVGEDLELPAGFEVVERSESWIAPGMVDLHSHIQTGGWGDINDMVLPVNPQYRTSPTIVPGNRLVRVACAGGVTTLFGIPGSGTNISGFGVLYKTKLHTTYESAVLHDPGGMKVAEDSNPQRGSGDLGAGRGAMSWMLHEVNDRAVAANEAGIDDPELRNLQAVHRRELPVLIHTAGSEGVVNTARMWRVDYPTRSTLSHGCFDAWKTSPAVAEIGMTVNNGPRTFDWGPSREGRIVGISSEYLKAGNKLVSLNTDSPVMPEEELFLQGAMSARLGADRYTMLRAVTINPAIQFGIDDRVGSLEPGKDADIVVWSGEPLDPRSRVELVLIDGHLEYDRERDGQVF